MILYAAQRKGAMTFDDVFQQEQEAIMKRRQAMGRSAGASVTLPGGLCTSHGGGSNAPYSPVNAASDPVDTYGDEDKPVPKGEILHDEDSVCIGGLRLDINR